MKVPCIVTRLLYVFGATTPPGATDCGSQPPSGIGWPGKPSCHRIPIASSPPTSRKNRLRKRNWIPMVL